MGKTIIDLGSSEATITDPSTYFIETQKIGETVTKKTVLTKIITYLQTLFAAKFDGSNTATGTTSVSINHTSGIATFTQNIAPQTQVNYSINNNTINAGDTILFTISGDFGNTAGVFQFVGYNAVNDAIDLFFYNAAASDPVDVNIVVAFEKIN